jgi:uncharacterized protein (TIGR02246 family)
MSTHSTDEAAIRQVVQAVAEAFNRGDAKAIATHYAADADYVDSFGNVSKGRANIEQTFLGFLTGPYRGGKFAPHIDSIRFLTATMALLDITWDVTAMQGPPVKVHGASVFVKLDEQWVSTAGRAWVLATAAP